MVRELVGGLAAGDFLHHPVARDMVQKGVLVDFELPDPTHVVAPRIAFVSQPSEWCRLQLLDAALLTLDVAEQALREGFEIKDASAWNVIFDGCKPVFCDHLSFEPVRHREWRALGQFARHFILPLLVAEKSGLPTHAQFRVFRDGITLQLARRMCGWRMWFSRAMPLAFAGRARDAHTPANSGVAAGSSASLHSNLYRFCRSSLPSRARAATHRVQDADSTGTWSTYSQDRDHYPTNAIQAKQKQVLAWMERVKASWILDLGANTGEFSFLAARTGARVIAVDSDHDSIERLYLQALSQPPFDRTVHPVVAQLDDLCAGRGWRGSEAPGLPARLEGRCDLVLMLGLVHHLAIAGAIPVAEIAAFAASLTRSSLIMEIVAEGDPMFRKLALQYGRGDDAAATSGQAAQLAALARHFETVERCPLPDSQRTLLLLLKKSS